MLVEMNRQQVLRDLKEARKAIDKAIRSLNETQSDLQTVLASCRFCGKPIVEGEPTQREIHSKCYQKAYNQIRKKETTIEELENLGLIGPAARPGRRAKESAAGIIEAARREIDGNDNE